MSRVLAPALLVGLLAHSCLAFSPQSSGRLSTTTTNFRSLGRVAALKVPDVASKLPDERILDALERAPTRGRATAADVASLAGVSLEEAKAGLVLLTSLLAADKDTRMEVDADGEVAFGFAPNVRAAVARSSRASRWRNRWRRAKPYLEKGGKTMFGIGLVVNVATVWAMVSALQASAKRSGDNDDGGSFGSGGGSFMAFRLLDVIDLLRFRDRMM